MSVSVVGVTDLSVMEDPTLLLLQDVSAICVPDTACRCSFVGDLRHWCRAADPIWPQPGMGKCHRSKEKGSSDLHLGGDVRMFSKGLSGMGVDLVLQPWRRAPQQAMDYS